MREIGCARCTLHVRDHIYFLCIWNGINLGLQNSSRKLSPPHFSVSVLMCVITPQRRWEVVPTPRSWRKRRIRMPSSSWPSRESPEGNQYQQRRVSTALKEYRETLRKWTSSKNQMNSWNLTNLMNRSPTSTISFLPLVFANYGPHGGFPLAPRWRQQSADFGDARNPATVITKSSSLVILPDQHETRRLTRTMTNTRTRNLVDLMPHPLRRKRRGPAPRLLVPHMVTSVR